MDRRKMLKKFVEREAPVKANRSLNHRAGTMSARKGEPVSMGRFKRGAKFERY